MTGLGHPHSEKMFLVFRGNLLRFGLCPLLLVLALVTTKDSLQLCSLPSVICTFQ